jgi:calnexin
MKNLLFVCLLTFLYISLVKTQNESKEFSEKDYKAPSAGKSYFFDNFNKDSINNIWIPSKVEKYNGVWKHSSAMGSLVGISDDFGLLLTEEAKHYALSATFQQPIDNKDKDLVIQYEVKFETDSGMSCGGAYVKLLSEEVKTEKFDNESPYIIMFGPDKVIFKIKISVVLQIKYTLFSVI